MITWHLGELMTRHDIENSDLAREMGVHRNTISRYRTLKSFPGFSADRFNSLIASFNKLSQKEYNISDFAKYQKEERLMA